MPIVCNQIMRPFDRDAFGKLSFAAFGDLLAIRKELGRFFDEKHYKRALALRRSDVLLEEPIHVTHSTFQKTYFLDVLLALGGLLEFKAAEALVPRHKAQLLNYLMLAELKHGMLINVRPEMMTREFVNNVLCHRDRLQFEIVTDEWEPSVPGAGPFRQILSDILQDWGTSLDLGLYEEALTHFFGGKEFVIRPTTVKFDDRVLGPHALPFVTANTAFKLSALEDLDSQHQFAIHAQCLVNHASIEALLWANIGRHRVTLRCLKPKG